MMLPVRKRRRREKGAVPSSRKGGSIAAIARSRSNESPTRFDGRAYLNSFAVHHRRSAATRAEVIVYDGRYTGLFNWASGLHASLVVRAHNALPRLLWRNITLETS